MHAPIRHIICCLILGCCLGSCKDDIYRNPIPDAPVSLNLNLLAHYPTFRGSANQYLIFTEPRYLTDFIGYGGILVYTTFEGKYTAYDLACPQECRRDVRVEHCDSVGICTFRCPQCGECYELSYGFGVPTKGICRYPLKQYKTMLSSNSLYIYLK